MVGAFGAAAHAAQVLEGVDARAVAVAEREGERVVSDELGARGLHVRGHRGGIEQHFARPFVLAHGAGAVLPQELEGELADVVVLPGDPQAVVVDFFDIFRTKVEHFPAPEDIISFGMRQALIIGLLIAFSALSARAEADREVVRVNGTPIRQSEVMERLWQRYGDQTLDEMIDELLLRQAAQKDGVKVSPAEIEKRFTQVKSQFTDPKIMEAQLEQYGSSVDKLKQQIGEEIGREKVVMARKKIVVTDDELREAFK